MTLTVGDLKLGTKFQFTKVPNGSYATVGVDYVIDAACKHNLCWRRINADGSLGSGSGDSRSMLRFGSFKSI